jgi:type I restriction enzyme S subunit
MSWHTMTLGDVVTLKRGHDLPERDRREGPVPIVSSSGVTGFHNVAKAEPPGVVTGRYGTLGEVYFINEPYWPLNTSLYAIDFHENDPKFVAYFLRQVLKGASSNNKAAVPGVNRNDLHALKVNVPIRDVQERIAGMLTAYDDLIENNLRRIKLLEEAARLIYREWFVYLRFPGHEHTVIQNGVPNGWHVGNIGAFYDTSSGGTPSRSNPDYFTGEINWAKTQELNENFIYETDEKITDQAVLQSAAKLFPEGTLLVSIYGNTNIGRTAILASPSSCNQACVGLIPKHECATSFLAQLHIQNIRSSLIGMSQGAAQTNISQQTLRDVKMTLPSKLIAEAFMEIVQPLYLLKGNLEQQVVKLQRARDLLLPRLISGEIEL